MQRASPLRWAEPTAGRSAGGLLAGAGRGTGLRCPAGQVTPAGASKRGSRGATSPDSVPEPASAARSRPRIVTGSRPDRLGRARSANWSPPVGAPSSSEDASIVTEVRRAGISILLRPGSRRAVGWAKRRRRVPTVSMPLAVDAEGRRRARRFAPLPTLQIVAERRRNGDVEICPIGPKEAVGYLAVEGAVRPVASACHQPMPNRIEVHVVDVRG